MLLLLSRVIVNDKTKMNFNVKRFEFSDKLLS